MMREPVDLRRAVKEEVGRDLAELTFTPEMRERVLARLPKRPRSRLTWLYPASAAAAVLLILVTSTTQLMQRTGEQGSAAESARQEAPAAPTEAHNSTGANAKSAPPAELVATGQPKSEAGMKAHSLDAPVTAFGVVGDSAMADRALPAGPQMALLPAAQSVVTLTAGTITRIDPAGAPVWQVALPASKQAEQVVATPEGKLVVAASSTVLLLGPDGSMQESLQLTEPILRIAVGSHDRLALVGERAVYTRQAAGRPLVALAASNASEAAFTSDGLLLLTIPEGLVAYDGDGNRRWLATGEGGSLLVSPDGKTILWGSTLYSSAGLKLSDLEFASGTAAGGPGLLRYSGEQLSAVTWEGKAAWSWTAPGFITSVFVGEGDRIWAVLEGSEGVKLQGLQGTTGRPVGKTMPLTATPQEAIAVDGRLYLRLPEGLTILPL